MIRYPWGPDHSIFVYLVVDLNGWWKNWSETYSIFKLTKVPKFILLTFQSLARRCRPPPTRTAASATVVAFDDCIGIIIGLLLLVVDLSSILEFIDEVIQCLEFNAHLEFMLSGQDFQGADLCEQLRQFAVVLSRHVHFLSGVR